MEKSKTPNPFEETIKEPKGEKMPTPEQLKEDEFLDNLVSDLNLFRDKQLETEKVDEIITNREMPFLKKIRALIDMADAKSIKDIAAREAIYNKIFGKLKQREGEEVLNAFSKNNLRLAELHQMGKEKEYRKTKKELEDKIGAIQSKYSIISDLFDELNLGLQKGGSFNLE